MARLLLVLTASFLSPFFPCLEAEGLQDWFVETPDLRLQGGRAQRCYGYCLCGIWHLFLFCFCRLEAAWQKWLPAPNFLEERNRKTGQAFHGQL